MGQGMKALFSCLVTAAIVTAVSLAATEPALALVPIDPVPVATADGARDGHTVKVDWTESVGAATYTVEYRLLGAPDWMVGAGSIVATTYTVGGLVTGATYQFQVAANNFGGSRIGVSSPVSAVVTDVMLPVHRFYNQRTGAHFYTASESEKDHVIATFPTILRYEGPAYCVNTARPANDSPLHRFYNLRTGVHFYTASESEKDHLIATFPTILRYEGPAYNVSLDPADAPVYRFYNLSTGVHFYTASESEKDHVIATFPTILRYEGPVCYLAQ